MEHIVPYTGIISERGMLMIGYNTLDYVQDEVPTILLLNLLGAPA